MATMDPQAATALNGIAADARSLDQLRRVANQDPAKAIKQVATQFEALFMQMVLKSMREASPKSGLLDSPDHQMYTSMLDEQLAQKIAAGGTGLADVIARQLSRNLPPPSSTPGKDAALAGAAPANPGSPGVGAPLAAGPAAAGARQASATTVPVATGAGMDAAPGSGDSPAGLLRTLRAAAGVRGAR